MYLLSVTCILAYLWQTGNYTESRDCNYKVTHWNFQMPFSFCDFPATTCQLPASIALHTGHILRRDVLRFQETAGLWNEFRTLLPSDGVFRDFPTSGKGEAYFRWKTGLCGRPWASGIWGPPEEFYLVCWSLSSVWTHMDQYLHWHLYAGNGGLLLCSRPHIQRHSGSQEQTAVL